MKRLNIRRSLTLYRQGLKLIPWASQTGSKRPTEYAYGAYPIYIERGKGCHVWDVDGNRYIDYILALGPITLGYCYEPVDRGVRAQMKKGVIFGLMHPLEVEAAKAVTECVPSAEQVRFFKTGAEATSAAVRVARIYTGRDIILHCGYHGWLDPVSASFPNNPGVPAASRRLIQTFPWSDLGALQALLEKHPGQVAAVMLNPIHYHQVNDRSFLAGIRRLCNRHGALMIYDEIVTGFRLALGGAQEYFRVLPDLSCFAKGIANGYPVSALCGRRKVMQAMENAMISSTYGGETLSLAAVTASIREYRRHRVPTFLARQGQKLMNGLNEAAARVDIKARWVGYPAISFYAFEYPDSDTNRDCTTFWLQECAKRGVLFRRGGGNCVSFSHNNRAIQETVTVGTEVLCLLKKALQEDNLGRLLETRGISRGRYER